MITTERKRCKSKTKTGQPCQGITLEDGYCFSHSPTLEEKRQEARAKGGRHSSRAARLKKLVPPRLISVYDKLEAALTEVHSGELESKQATAMAAIARAMVAVITSGELEERMRNLEHAMEKNMTLEKRISKIECYKALKKEVWVDIAATVVKDFVNLFEQVNKIENPEERKREFLKRGDALMIYH